ncbi:pentapeptide repeat-containing protein [Nonomuraea gerenzanensis]|uniref:pentapeptide repeat-containing protein n=1 Tax=Nonomuraea gerenzanensis TaxID=93944 RepID=UPI001CD9A37A|nr:pentapeptide repeat-containing protein [Nonomuraea gerenzanensis]UBU16594.1 pentapeptide repeat-containing protein [Nonomuraea gerenzanensis]
MSWTAFTALLATVLGIYLMAIAWAPRHLINEEIFHNPQATLSDRLNAEQGARLLVTSIAGALVVFGGLIFTGVNYLLSRRGQITDRFSKALERLGSAELYERIGGIYALERVIRDSPSHRDDVTQVLAAFIRARTPPAQSDVSIPSQRRRFRWPWQSQSNGNHLPLHPSEDVQAALTALGRRPRQGTRPANGHALRRHVDLSDLHLRGAQLSGMDMRRFKLEGADLRGAALEGADLRDSDISWADLRNARLFGANLRRADLTGINLRNASLVGADLRDTRLGSADLRQARLGSILPRFIHSFVHADPKRLSTRLIWGRRWGYSIVGADLRGALFGNTDLRGAILVAVDLHHVNLNGANLQGAQFDEPDMRQEALETIRLTHMVLGIYDGYGNT